MPILNDEIRMEKSPHLDYNFSADVAKRRDAAHIGKEVEEAGEEAQRTSPPSPRSYGRIMVH